MKTERERRECVCVNERERGGDQLNINDRCERNNEERESEERE